MTPLVNRWQKFPILHRRVLLVLVPVVLVLLILPTTEQLNNDIGEQDTSVRRDIALTIASEELATSEELAPFEEPVEFFSGKDRNNGNNDLKVFLENKNSEQS